MDGGVHADGDAAWERAEPDVAVGRHSEPSGRLGLLDPQSIEEPCPTHPVEHIHDETER